MIHLSKRFVLSVLIIAVTAAFAQAQTQMQMNKEACDAYKKADAEMNSTYQKILTEYKADAQFIQKLKLAQRAWIAFRDAHVESIYPATDKRAQYGSINPMCQCKIFEELTTARNKDAARVDRWRSRRRRMRGKYQAQKLSYLDTTSA
jgi:uncharacterized protein YecT (DUF1311 family)